ncbi:hypothetical protein BVZ31_18695 [Alcaligenes faecalis]|nr:hypothetical protein BVZ31_18695 [Alcaligenes faecalis]OSZ53642.1 hypothetical protein BVZ32_07280 [Alcaligenes faecalis]
MVTDSILRVAVRPRALRAGRLLGELFTEIPRGNIRLGLSGGIGGARDAQHRLVAGADFVYIGHAAIADYAFAKNVLADADYRAPTLPLPVEHFMSQGRSAEFVNYLRSYGGFITPRLINARPSRSLSVI